MDVLIVGTTPTITYSFSTVDVSLITDAYLTIKCSGKTVIEKAITDATVTPPVAPSTTGTISWKLGQADTLKLSGYYNAEAYCDWKTQDNTRGSGEVGKFMIQESGKECEI